eukprot:CAMPEP_0198696246 /NCGR_PEP_ID=MMETSP1468-20131203/302885_1 /TAXON_ID=1461545 /ORGANISM="Mantoniella sp, Strain CCMP1436" /LENGTH=52 /DNA_ID=CAMNT_0044452387 /DNA_START=68 /DNA_END=223 /DNA_ORIENTATION=-
MLHADMSGASWWYLVVVVAAVAVAVAQPRKPRQHNRSVLVVRTSVVARMPSS